MGYTITGIIFGCSFFLLLINVYHYKEVNDIYVKSETDLDKNKEIMSKLNNIKENISVFDISNYNGTNDKQSLFSIQNKLNLCINAINNDTLSKILNKKKISIKDVYQMQQFYQNNISNECLIKQIYELTLPNSEYKALVPLNSISPFIEDNIEQLKDSTDYTKKVIKSNSNYYFSSDISKTSLYNRLDDSYYEILNNYDKSLDFLEDLSIWYKEVVGGK